MLYDIVSAAYIENPKMAEGAIGREVWDAIRLRIEPNSKTLEFGCGLSTLLFECARCRHTAIDHSEKWLDKVRRFDPAVYLIQSRLKENGFYDNVPDEVYDCILIDGPAGEGNRTGVLEVIERLVKKGTAIIVDDTNRPKDKELSEAIQKLLEPEHVIEGDTSHNRKFDMIIV